MTHLQPTPLLTYLPTNLHIYSPTHLITYSPTPSHLLPYSSTQLIPYEEVKTYVNRILIERVRDEKTVKKVLDILEEKYKMTKCERIKEVEKKWMDFRADDKVDTLIDKLEEIVTEMETLGLLNDVRKYAISARFIDKLEESGKINSTEKLRLRDIVQDVEGNPRINNVGETDTMEKMKKELKNLKVAENREKPFSKETKTYYTRTDGDRSRYDNWRNKMRSGGFKRDGSSSWFRTSSKGKCEHEQPMRYARNGSRAQKAVMKYIFILLLFYYPFTYSL